MNLETLSEDYNSHKPMLLPIVREYGGMSKNQTANIPQIIGEGLTGFEQAPQSQKMSRT